MTSSAAGTGHYEGVTGPPSIPGSGVVRAADFSSPPLSLSHVAFFLARLTCRAAPRAEEEVMGQHLVRDFITPEFQVNF